MLGRIRAAASGAWEGITGARSQGNPESPAGFQTGGLELLSRGRRNTDFVADSTTTLTYAPILHSVRKISGHVGTAPRLVQRVDADESVTTYGQRDGLSWQGRLHDLLNLDPNGMQTAHDLIETVQKDAHIDGNGRIAIIRGRGQYRGEPYQLIRLAPSMTYSFLSHHRRPSSSLSNVSDNGSPLTVTFKWHHATATDGSTHIFPDADVIHVKGLQHDGLTGIPIWEFGSDSIGGGKDAERHSQRLVANKPGLVLEAPKGTLDNLDKARSFYASFVNHFSGRGSGAPALLRFGVTARPMGADNRAAQLIEQREFSRAEAWLLTGDIMLWDSGGVYRSGVELDTGFAKHTMSPWRSKWQQELNLKLLTFEQRLQGYRIQIDLDHLLRGTNEEQMAYLTAGRQIGMLSEEDTRRYVGKSPQRKEAENYDNPNTTAGPAAGGTVVAGDDVNVETSRGDELQIKAQGYRGQLERDRWIYEQHVAGTLTLAEISARIIEENPNWDLIGTEAGIRTASHRYADHCGLPRANRNRPSVSAETAG